MDIDRDALQATLGHAREQLLAWRLPSGHWEGELCSSALSTATAVAALALLDRPRHEPLIGRGLGWLAGHANPDGGWGDSTLSRSNIATTALAWAAFAIAGLSAEHRPVVACAEAWLERAAGGLRPDQLEAAVADRYGSDRTFSVPILATCALAGKLGEGRAAWRRVAALPFELGVLSHRWLRWLRLPVVSYALPALIAIGQSRFHHMPPRNPLARLVRALTRRRTLERLAAVQPPSGGFLEATPLTSFVVMNLVAAGRADHAVAARGADFLARSARDDGSWPIDTNLATWATTLSVNALAAAPDFARRVSAAERRVVLDWLLGQQHVVEHPFTGAAPGGWAWTDLPGGVPDADDTAGALLALRGLALDDPRVLPAASAGIEWLLGLQNRDGGVPTFCRGWGHLPFDRSGADLTAHALRALVAWRDRVAPPLARRLDRAIRRAVGYLAATQRTDGSWVPLWFGNEATPDEANPVFGTARVLAALASPGVSCGEAMAVRATQWLAAARNPDGGWGGAPGVASSLEETGLAVAALAALLAAGRSPVEGVEPALADGVAWLVERTGRGTAFAPSPIGFYFARLWYYEHLYPLVFALSALERTARLLALPRTA